MTIHHAHGYELAALQSWYDVLSAAIHKHDIIRLQDDFVAVIRAIRAARRQDAIQ